MIVATKYFNRTCSPLPTYVQEWSITLHNTASSCYRRKLLIADNIYDELHEFKDEVWQRLLTAPVPWMYGVTSLFKRRNLNHQTLGALQRDAVKNSVHGCKLYVYNAA